MTATMSRHSLDCLYHSALSFRETVQMSYKCAAQLIEDEVPGDFVECGVYAGSQCAAMAFAILDKDDSRKIHLFDNFEGIPEPGPEDGEFRAAGHHAGLSRCSIESVRGNMIRWGVPDSMLVYHQGDFSQTAPEFHDPIAMLRLDGDLYESTKVCLEHLYPLLSRNGICIVDDIALDGCRKAVLEYIGGALPPIYWRKTS